MTPYRLLPLIQRREFKTRKTELKESVFFLAIETSENTVLQGVLCTLLLNNEMSLEQ